MSLRHLFAALFFWLTGWSAIQHQHCCVAEEYSLLEEKTKNQNAETQYKKNAQYYRRAANNEKGDLAESLYSLSLTCDEIAGVYDKIGDLTGDDHRNAELLNFQQQLAVLLEKLSNLKIRAAALGYKDEDVPDSSDFSTGTNATNNVATATNGVQSSEINSSLLGEKLEHKKVRDELLKRSEAYKEAAKNEKSDLSVTLYGLAQACSEKAALHDKLAGMVGQNNFDMKLGIQKQLLSANQKIITLTQKAEDLGYRTKR